MCINFFWCFFTNNNYKATPYMEDALWTLIIQFWLSYIITFWQLIIYSTRSRISWIDYESKVLDKSPYSWNCVEPLERIRYTNHCIFVIQWRFQSRNSGYQGPRIALLFNIYYLYRRKSIIKDIRLSNYLSSLIIKRAMAPYSVC